MAIMKSLLCSFFCALGFTSAAQTPEDVPSLPNLLVNCTHAGTNSQQTSSLNTSLTQKLTTHFQISKDAVYQLNVTIEIGKSRTIEGMDTKTFTEVTFHQSLQNLISKDTISVSTSQISGKAMNESAAIRDAIKKYVESPGYVIGLRQTVDADITSYFDENCTTALSQIPVKGDETTLTRAFVAMEYLGNGSCAKSALAKTESILSELDRITCETVMYDLEIKVSSGIYNPNEVLGQLLRISPNAPCAGKALELAKKMGESQTRLQTQEREAADNYINIYLHPEQAEQFPRYRKLYWRYY